MSRYNPKGKPTKQEFAHMWNVAQMPCIVTGRSDVQIHHITEGGRRLGNFWVLPLSVETHRNISKIPFAEQMELCREVYKRLGQKFPEPPTKIVKRLTK